MTTALDYFTQIESNIKFALRNTIISVGTTVLLASCASAPPTNIHETVGPSPAAANQEHNGFLMVYSATAWTTDGDGPSLLNHTKYEIDAADGTLFQEVPNSDQEPSRVVLPKGTYTIVAQSDTFGTVRVPVAIETDRTTIVHLEGEKDWKEAGIRSADLVRLPNGQPIGFRVQHPELLKSPVVAAVAKSQ